MKATEPAIEPNNVLLYFIDHFMLIGIKGLLVAGLIALIMSMAEAILSSGALVVYRNIICSFLPQLSEKAHLNIFKAIIIALASSSLLLIDITASSIIGIFWLAGNFWDPIIFIPALAGFISFRTNHISFISSTAIVLIAVISGRIYSGEFATISYMFGVLGWAAGFFGAHYFQMMCGKIPYIKQTLEVFQFKKFKQNVKLWGETLYKDYKKNANNAPNCRNFLIFAYVFIAPQLVNIMWYGAKSIVLVGLWIISHALCLPLLIKEALLPAVWLKKIIPLYFKIALVITPFGPL